MHEIVNNFVRFAVRKGVVAHRYFKTHNFSSKPHSKSNRLSTILLTGKNQVLTGAPPHVIIMTSMLKDEVIRRVCRQHNSLVLVVPIAVRSLLDIHNGDYVFFTWTRGRKSVRFGKVKIRKELTDGRKKHTIGKN